MRNVLNMIERVFGPRVTSIEDVASGALDRLSDVEEDVSAIGPPAALRDSATIAFNTVIATDAVTINGVTLTAVANAATPSAGQFKIGAEATVDQGAATNLAALINSLTATTLPGVRATAAEKVVTVTGDPGVLLVITTEDTTVTVAYTAPSNSLYTIIRQALESGGD